CPFTLLLLPSFLPIASFSSSTRPSYNPSYSPTVEVSTSPETSIASDTSPSTSSSAVAPGSSYVSPTSSSIGLSPFNVISGATVSSAPSSFPAALTRLLSLFVVPVSLIPSSSVAISDSLTT